MIHFPREGVITVLLIMHHPISPQKLLTWVLSGALSKTVMFLGGLGAVLLSLQAVKRLPNSAVHI